MDTNPRRGWRRSVRVRAVPHFVGLPVSWRAVRGLTRGYTPASLRDSDYKVISSRHRNLNRRAQLNLPPRDLERDILKVASLKDQVDR